MARQSLSGFPEWPPAGRVVEQHVLDHVRRTFELHGYAGIETRAVEPLEDLLRKGETSKEVYVLRRLHDEGETSRERQLALHFDLTVPLARYILENTGNLAFPFKRYQIQKAWRGERPQDGRFREFTQADIDVVCQDSIPFQYEVELPIVVAEALKGLPIPAFRIGVNNRKVSQGFYEAVGIADVEGALRAIDKLGKIGPDGVTEELTTAVGATAEQAEAALRLAGINAEDESFADRVLALGHRSALLDEGLEELTRVVAAGVRHMPGVLVADLSIARGLDYYTGTVYETTFVGHEGLGSVASGGRYDSLVSDGRRTYPGVGMSIGISRIMSRILGSVTATRPVPTAVLVAVVDEDSRPDSESVARELRARGIPAEVSATAEKFGKQIRYADRRSIPYVWFPQSGEVKDIRSGAQVAADPLLWEPPRSDWWPRVVATDEH